MPHSKLISGVRAGERRALAKAITLVESKSPRDLPLATEVLDAILPFSGQAMRIGISGSPGVGKSTLIEALGLHLIAQGKKVAVLAVDPSSPVSKGSVLGDKTRMPRLSLEASAFVRPSPSGGLLGGVARQTREAMLLCEAAGFDVVLVETVGVGQSEFAVAAMVDTFVLLMQPGAGDELQGVKKGVLELADMVVVTKADGQLLPLAKEAQKAYARALSLLRRSENAWKVPVLTVSSPSETGIAALWEAIQSHQELLRKSDELEKRRQDQAQNWFWSIVGQELLERFRQDVHVRKKLPGLLDDMRVGKISVSHAVQKALKTTST